MDNSLYLIGLNYGLDLAKEDRYHIYYKQLDSTNTEIARLAAMGATHGTVVVADAQTAGKGRRGRQWESPAGENIYMSILLRPDCVPDSRSYSTGRP